MLSKVFQDNALLEASDYASPGLIDGILVTYVGVNAAGQTGTLDDLGTFQIERNGDSTHNKKATSFARIGDIRAGSNVFNSVTAGVFEASIFIPFFELGLPNALLIREGTELDLQYQPATNVATVFSSLTVTAYSRQAWIPERYTYKMLGNNVTYNAAVDKPEVLSGENVTNVYFYATTGAATKLQLKQGTETVIGNIEELALRAATIYNNNIEDPTFETLQLRAYTPGAWQSAYAPVSTLNIETAAAAAFDITVCRVMPGAGWPKPD